MIGPMTTVHRIEVRPAPGAADPKGQAIVRDAKALGYPIESVRTGRVYLIQGAQIGRASCRERV